MPQALIVDDDAEFRDTLARVVESQGFTTVVADSLEAARSRIAKSTPDVILTDLMLPDGTGLDLRGEPGEGPRPELILITGHASVDSAVEALRGGVLDYLTKPVDVPRLKAVLANVLRTLGLKEEIGSLRGELRKLGRFGPMIGGSPAMQAVYDRIARVAPTEATVLVTGESGTGKELVAQTLHALGGRRKGPFIPVNCSAVPPNLIESELFGHERGSFTGATQMHRGVFERAAGGTLFLDEITEMPAELQARLLRVLEARTLTRVGGEDSLAVDVRLVAATNRSPEQAVKQGTLRQDLYYRLNVFPILLPPLRERGEDIVQLAAHFLDELNEANGTAKRLAPISRERLLRHTWPGNVRELRNVLQRDHIMAGDELRMDPLVGVATTELPDSHGGGEDGVQAGMTLVEVERRVILATLERCGGDKRQAAHQLGISLKTLYNRLNVYAGRTPS
jgi:two-component system, NtrC family, response regulator AtoC